MPPGTIAAGLEDYGMCLKARLYALSSALRGNISGSGASVDQGLGLYRVPRLGLWLTGYVGFERSA